MIGNDEKAAARAAVKAQIAQIEQAERDARRPLPRLEVEGIDSLGGVRKGELISFCAVGYEDFAIRGHAVATRDISPEELLEKIRQVGAVGKYEFCDTLRGLLIYEGAATPIVSTMVSAYYEWSSTGDELSVALHRSAENDTEQQVDVSPQIR